MKYIPFIIITLLLACCHRPTPRNDQAELDSLSQQLWHRELNTGRAVKLTEGKSPLPEKLYIGTREDFKDDSAYFADLLTKLKGIDITNLPPTALVDYDLLHWIAEVRLEATRYYDNVFPIVTPYAHHLSGSESILKQGSISTEAEAARYYQLLEQYHEIQKSDLARLRAMDSRGIRMARPEIDLTIGLIKSMQVEPTRHACYPQTARLEKLDSTVRVALQQKVVSLLVNRIIPYHDSLASWLAGPYRSRATNRVGLGQYPGGKEYYRYLVKWHTTTDLTPAEIHEMGMREVASIYRKLDSIRVATGFEGDMKSFYRFLQQDKRFLASTPDEVAARLKKPLLSMDTAIHQLISIRPKAGYDIRRLSPELEPAITFGNYLPPTEVEPLGIYYFNGSKLEQRPLTSAASLAFHEIMPGHHWQICLQSENTHLSEFRKNTYVTAYLEGWGEYASWLGIELGLYRDPYDYCGRLLMDMFISVRLVVDTGMNDLGWSLEQAMDFMRAHVIESDEQIKTESIRYSCDIPAQALGYKIGSLKLIALRKKYQTALGSNFIVVRFHDAILRTGNLPLAVLEKALDREFGVK